MENQSLTKVYICLKSLKQNKSMSKEITIVNNDKELGKYIRKLRKKHQMTLEKLGEKLDLGKSYLSQVENGSRNLSIPQLLKCMQLFKVAFVNYESEPA